MPNVCVVVAAAGLLLGCGSSAGSLDGKVKGHEVSVKEAVFIPLDDGEVLVVAADQESLCAVLNGQQRPSQEMNLLEVFLANWNGNAMQPPVTGSYTLSTTATTPGLYSYAVLFWTRECITFGALGPTGGQVNVESAGGPLAGAHTVVSVDLRFASDHLSGRIDAVYCAPTRVQGTACQPQLRAPGPTPAVE